MKDFRQLHVWQRAHALALAVYLGTDSFPADERFGITSQIRRAVVTIPTNIAEGCGRDGDAELARILNIAAGSASEVEYLLLLANNLNYLTNDEYVSLQQQTVEVKRMLSGFIKRLRGIKR